MVSVYVQRSRIGVHVMRYIIFGYMFLFAYAATRILGLVQ